MKLFLALFCYITGIILPFCTTTFNLKHYICQSCHLLIVPKSLHSAKELLRTTCHPRVYYKQDRQCKYNVTLRRVRATNVAMEMQRVLQNLSVCICRLRYPACNAHAPYCHLLPTTLIRNLNMANTNTSKKLYLADKGGISLR
jgi:hypothetical protein